METFYPLYWETVNRSKLNNIVTVKITGINSEGKLLVFEKYYKEWIGVCTSNINKIVKKIKYYFPTCKVFINKLNELTYKKVLPYFNERLKTGKLNYSCKPFYKLYISAPIADVGSFFNKYKISYFDKEDWLVRIYIDFCSHFDISEFYYMWYNVDISKKYLIESFQVKKSYIATPKICIAAFDLELVALSGNDRIPTGHDEMDCIVMISIVKWTLAGTKESVVMYLNPIGERLNLPNYREYFTEIELIEAFHSYIEDVHILTGYNINKYDIPCLIARLIWLNEKKLYLKYSSKKIGAHIVPTYKNKICIDMFCYIITFSSYGLPGFKLDTVAQYKLNKSKVPISPVSLQYWYSKNYSVTKELLLCSNSNECFQLFKPHNVKIIEFGTFLKCIEYCLVDSELVYDLFQHELALEFLIERANTTALNVEQVLFYGNSKYILEVLKTCGTRLGYFLNFNHFQNKMEADSKKIQDFFISSTYQGALNYCIPGTFFKNIYVFDFASMYPSILLNQNLCYGTCSILTKEEYFQLSNSIKNQCAAVPYRTHDDDEFLKINKFPFERYCHPKIEESDSLIMIWYKGEKGFLPTIVEYFLERRVHEKKLFKQTKLNIHYNKQLNIKLFLNSIYGCMASANTLLACLHIAMIITAFARLYLLATFEFFSSRGYVVANCDTDSTFVLGYNSTDSTEINKYLNQPYVKIAFERVMDYLLIIMKKMYLYETDNKLNYKGFEIKANKLTKWITREICENTMKCLKKEIDNNSSDGWVLWVNTLLRAEYMCRDPKKYCLTRKAKKLEDYVSTSCPQLKLLKKYPELGGQYIDYTYNDADCSSKLANSEWIMEVKDCNQVNIEKLFIDQKKVLIKLLKLAFFKNAHKAEIYCNEVLNTMKWKRFVHAELKNLKITNRNIMILRLKGVKYTFH